MRAGQGAGQAGAGHPGPLTEVDNADFVYVDAQDVYFAEEFVFRNPDSQTPGNSPLFNATGAPLDLTWREYASVAARSQAVTVRGDEPHTLFHLWLDGLVPNGVYSVFYTTFGPDSENPECPGVIRELPVTTLQPGDPPDESAFVADPNGTALFVGRVGGTVMDAAQVSLHVILHADGATYHPLLNKGALETQGDDCFSSYGVDAMRHVSIIHKWLS